MSCDEIVLMRIKISIKKQHLFVYENECIIKDYCVSTAKNGAGEIKGSEQTPLGLHQIRAKIGEGCPENTVFVGRRPTGEIYHPELRLQFPNRDWILTRIFWLSGLEQGKNRLGDVDTMQRYIYIHGSPDEVEMGKPGSRGCVRMRNSDILDLFKRVPVYTPVLIVNEDHDQNG